MKHRFLITLLTIFVLSLPTFAQVQRALHIGEEKFNYISYYPSPCDTSSVYVVQFHGAGEGGPMDGSKLTAIENQGFAQKAKAGTVYPFRLIAVQGYKVSGMAITSYTDVYRGIIPLLRKLGAKRVAFVGWSQGGQAALAQLWFNSTLDQSYHSYWKSITKIVVCFAGKWGQIPDYYPNGVDYNQALDIPVYCVHGTADESVNTYNGMKNWVQYKINSSNRANKAILLPIQNGNHRAAVDKGSNPSDPIGSVVYNQILIALRW